MVSKKIFNYTIIEIFLISSYLICWFSISTSLNDLIIFFENQNQKLNELINFLRQSLNLIIHPVLLIIFFNKFKNIQFRNELIFVLACLYFLFQIPGLFLTENSLTNIVFIISSLNILLIFILINIYFDEKRYFVFFIITFLILLLISILNYKAYIYFFFSESSSTLYSFFFSNETFLGKQSPRSTGSSRTLLLILIISFLIFRNFFQKNKFLKILVYLFLATLILIFQSRTTTVLLIVFVIMNCIFEKKYTLKELLKYIFIYLFLPVLMVYLTLVFKQLIHIGLIHQSSIYYLEIDPTVVGKDFKRPFDSATYSSCRVEEWKNILIQLKSAIIFG